YKSLELTLVGAKQDQYAPFSIAMASGTSDNYSSLRLVGSGVFFERYTLTYHTGADPDEVPQETGPTVDIPFITSRAQASEVAAQVMRRMVAPRMAQTINVANLKGPSGKAAF